MAIDARQARYIRWAQDQAVDTLYRWSAAGMELGTKTHADFQIATKRLAWLLARDLFADELWFGSLGNGNKIHACRGSHAICHSASGRGIRSGMVAAHSIDFRLTADDVTCEKCRAALPAMQAWLEEKKNPQPVDLEALKATDSMPLPQSPDHDKNERRYGFGGKDWAPCRICGRPVKNDSPNARMIHEHMGGGMIVTERLAALLDSASDLGGQVIGPECWRKHPEISRFLNR